MDRTLFRQAMSVLACIVALILMYIGTKTERTLCMVIGFCLLLAAILPELIAQLKRKKS
jgi:uncharacterized membrane protein HdeD (DUF308 family)